jgi:tetratricopeptide (TPR) repeat protein
MRKIPIAIIFFSAIAIGDIFCQIDDSMRSDFEDGQYFFNRGDYEDALYYYLKLVEVDSLNANFNFKVGECYINIPGKEQMAIHYFEIAKAHVVPKKAYRKRSVEENAAPLHVYFYLGNAYRMNNQLDKALSCYAEFIDSPFFYGNYNQNVVEKEIKTCERAKIIQDAPLDYEAINLGNAINSEYSEEKPVVSGDGNSIVFIRKLKFYDAIFYSTRNEGEWQQAVNINPQLLSDGEYYPTGLDFDGHELLLIRKEGDSYNIYTSHFDGEKWSIAKKMNDKINSLSDEIFASYSPDGKSIILASNKRSGKGGYDLYISRLSEKGTWQKPKNLGKGINTEFDEQTGFLTHNPEILFFSSHGHYTMGGFDIFYSKKNGKKWDTPINIGYPLNNTRDNLFYCPSVNDYRIGYYAQSTEGGYGGSDIYLIQIKSQSVLNFNKLKE